MTTQRIEINHTNKWERIIAAGLVFASLFFLGRWLNDQSLFESLTFIAMVALFHMIGNWHPPTETIRKDTVLGRIADTAQAEIPFLATWTGQGSRTAEVFKGVARGIVLLICREILLWVIMLVPGADHMLVETIATILVVGLVHAAENWAPRVTSDREATGLAKVMQTAQNESRMVALWTGQGSHSAEMVKGLAKGFGVVIGKTIMVATSVFFLSYWFAGGVVTLFIAYLIIPSSFRGIIDKILNPQRTPEASPATSDLPAADLIEGHEKA